VLSSKLGSNVFPIATGVVIIIFAIAIASAVQGVPDNQASQIVTVGPVWPTDAWKCTSDEDFMISATLRGIRGDPQIEISVQGHRTQSFFDLNVGELEAFSVGNQGGKTITITKTGGYVSGFLTLQTTSDVKASCVAV